MVRRALLGLGSAAKVPVLVIILSLAFLPGFRYAGGSERITLTDEVDDVLRTGYVDTKVGGNPELDIESLSSTETISDVTVVMRCTADLEESIGYLYTITVSGIHVSYQEGAFDVWKIGSEFQRIDNVLTDVTANEMKVTLKKTSIIGDFVMNCTANRYAVDWTKGATSESYYDVCGQFDEGTRAPVGGYTKDFDDPKGDVRLVYLDVEPVEEDGLDIIGLTLEVAGDIDLTLELGDEPLSGEDVEYVVYLLGSMVVWSAGEAEMLVEGEPPSSLDSEVSGSSITLNIPSEMVTSELGGVVVQARRTIDDDTYLQDLLPNDPYTISELLPFPPGSARSISLEVRSPDNIVMERSYYGFSAQAREDIRASIDADMDGSIAEGEVEDFLDDTLVGIISEHASDLTVDDRSGGLDVELRHEGLVGSTGSGDEIVITWVLNFTFDTGTGEDHVIDLEIDHFDPRLLPSPGFGEEEATYLVKVSIAPGWSIEPLTLEPAELANDMALEGRHIQHRITGAEAREFDAGSIGFKIREASDILDDDDTGGDVGEDLTWLYILILVVMVIVIAVIVVWSRRDIQ
ncbi:MAG: hypothetical protein ACMUHU_02335 [Thermoplasmatota archaeon]